MRKSHAHPGGSPGSMRPAAPDQCAAVSEVTGSAEAGAQAVAAGGRSVRLVGESLLALTKPRIIELLLVTTVPTMMLAARGLPAPGLLAVTLAGGALAAGSANTINCYLDRDIDAVMRRTSRRPLARPDRLAVIKPPEALAFGLGLGVVATLLLGLLVSWLAAALADAAIVFYIFVYTLGLKRRTASNIVIGGAAGGFPVLVGWAAVTGSVGWPSLVLFAVIFFWTPPHFWALALKFRADYAAAAVPMLPVVAPAWVVVRKIQIYSYAMVAATLALIPYAGWIYAAGAAGLGGWFVAEAHRLRSRVPQPASALTSVAPVRPGIPGQLVTAFDFTDDPGAEPGRRSVNQAAMRLFHLSIAYLSLLFALTAAASLLPWGRW